MKLPLILYERAVTLPFPPLWKGMVGNVPGMHRFSGVPVLASSSSKWEQHLFLLKWIFLWLQMLTIPLNKGNLRNSRCPSAGSASLHLQFKPTIWPLSYPRKHTKLHNPASRMSFSDTITSCRKTVVLKLDNVTFAEFFTSIAKT